MRRIAILDAPSNLGLRPPTATSVPGCAKAPGALRDHGLVPRLQARDAGCLTPPRYDPGEWRPGDGVCHAAEIATYSTRLADRIGAIIDAGEFPVVLGGDCSIVLGSALAMNRLGEAVGGRIGLIFVDGHSDFRHPGNASYVGAAAGEDLALVTGRGQADLAAIERRRPYYRDIDVVVMGIRAQDEYRLDLQAAGIVTRPVPTLRAEGAARSAQWAREQLVDCAGYWVHLDVDVLDPAVMPAVDAPSPGGIAFPELELLLAGLVDTPHCLGVEITVFDPDYDPDGSYAEEITSALVAGLAPVRTVAPRPDLVAARRADEEDAVRERRARAARDGVFPAAAAMSGGGTLPGTPAEAAAPAVTVLGVAHGDELGGAPGDEPRAAPGDEFGAGPGDEPRAASGDEFGAGPGDEPRAASGDEFWAGLGDGAGAARGDGLGVVPGDGPEGAPEDELGAAPEGELGAAPTSELGSAPGDTITTLPDISDMSEGEATWEEEGSAAPLTADDQDEARDAGEPEGEEPTGMQPAEPDSAEALASERHSGEDEDGPAAEPNAALVPRPLGSAPLLDSEPLPATRPGMLRPRPADTPADGFSLPAQRPAFDLGPEHSADIS